MAVLLLIGCGKGSDKPAVEPTPVAATAVDAAPAADDSAMWAKCCAQCSGAAGRDPAGMDISVKQCTSYRGEFNGGPGVDEACFAYFQAKRTILRDCQASAPPANP